MFLAILNNPKIEYCCYPRNLGPRVLMWQCCEAPALWPEGLSLVTVSVSFLCGSQGNENAMPSSHASDLLHELCKWKRARREWRNPQSLAIEQCKQKQPVRFWMGIISRKGSNPERSWGESSEVVTNAGHSLCVLREEGPLPLPALPTTEDIFFFFF